MRPEMIRFKASVLNSHFFDNTGKWAGKPLGFVYRDRERAEALTRIVNGSEDDAWLLAEVWDEDLGKWIAKKTENKFPYAAHSPYYRGFDDLRSYLDRILTRDLNKAIQDRKWGNIASLMLFRGLATFVDGNIHFFTRYLAGDHFSRSLNPSQKKGLMDSLLQMEIGQRHLNSLVDYTLDSIALEGSCWGGGLLLLSRHPFDKEPRFHPFPREAKTEYERIAGKGILEAPLRLPHGIRLDLFLTHFQEGESRAAIVARKSQMEFFGARVKDSEADPGDPKLMAGDFNIIAEKPFPKRSGRRQSTREYVRLAEALKGVDAFREIHPSPDETPGYTWIPGTKIEEALNGPVGEAREGARIDYLFRKGRLKTVHAESRPLTLPFGEHVSDHCLVRGEFEIPG